MLTATFYLCALLIQGLSGKILQCPKRIKYNEAFTLGDSILNNPDVSAHSTLVMADMIFGIKGIETNASMLDLGFRSALKGVALTDEQSPRHLSILAKGYALKNNKKMALITIQKAINLSQGDFQESIKKIRLLIHLCRSG